jgi:membrane protease YdiL (CAAX protease family)
MVAGARRAGYSPGVIEESRATLPPLTRRLIRWEIIVVFALSLGGSALFAIINLIGSLTAAKPLGKQQALLVGSFAPGRPWLDLALQLANIAVTLAPVALVFYLLARDGEGPSAIGLDAAHPAGDAVRGVLLAALIGGSGLTLYYAAFRLGVSLNVVPENLPAVWWRFPVLILDGIQNGVLEEILVVGYLLRRLSQLGWSPARSIAASALLRGSYHLYQGFGGFFGNAVMGVIFGVLYRRWGRVTPLIIAHSLIDVVAFTGYAALHGHVSWLP